jgi:hypothetical protein
MNRYVADVEIPTTESEMPRQFGSRSHSLDCSWVDRPKLSGSLAGIGLQFLSSSPPLDLKLR